MKKIHSVALVGVMGASGAMAQPLPGVVPTPTTTLPASQQNAVLVNDPEILKSAGVDLSLGRALRQIAATAGVPQPDTAPAAMLHSMISSFSASSFINPYSRVVMPVTPRPGEAALSPANLLNTLDPIEGMHPYAFVNRLDLSGRNGNCGEMRAVYGLGDPQLRGNPNRKFFVILEAGIPYPSSSIGPASCLPLAKAWASHTGKTKPEVARSVEQIFSAVFLALEDCPVFVRPSCSPTLMCRMDR